VYVQADDKEDHQDDYSTGDAVSTITRGSSKIGWSALKIEWKESLYTDNQDAMSRMKNCILLNSGSTLSLFSNPELVENIRTTGRTLALATNASVKHSNKEVTVPGFGTVYDDEDAIANIFGLSDLLRRIIESHMIPTKKTHSWFT
jgi:FMN phosphatase YigB (HAD superfamily)